MEKVNIKMLYVLKTYGFILAVVSFLSFVQGFGMAMTSGSPEPLLRLSVVSVPVGLGISSIGLLLFKNWGRFLFVIFSISMSILLIHLTMFSSTWLEITRIFIPFLIIGIILFFIPQVRGQFK